MGSIIINNRNHPKLGLDLLDLPEIVFHLCMHECTVTTQQESRLMVVSREAKEEAASGDPTDSRLTLMSILQEQEL